MRNDMRYDYHVTEEGLANVVYQVDKGEEHKPRIVHPQLLPVVLEINKKRPQWQFIGRSIKGVSINNVWKPAVSLLLVLEKNEVLGSLEVASRYSRRGVKPAVEVKNERITAGRSQCGGFKTQNPAAAAAKALKMFRPKTDSERIQKAQLAIRAFANEHVLRMNQLARSSYACFASLVEDTITASPYLDPLMEVARRYANKEQQALLDVLVTSRQDSVVMKQIADSAAKQEGATILVDGGNYLVSGKDGLSTHTTDTLPDWIKPKLGMLKLLESAKVVPGIGTRLNGNTFFVVGD